MKSTEARDVEIGRLKELVSGAKPIIECWNAEMPYQKVWKTEWIYKAKDALKGGK